MIAISQSFPPRPPYRGNISYSWVAENVENLDGSFHIDPITGAVHTKRAFAWHTESSALYKLQVTATETAAGGQSQPLSTSIPLWIQLLDCTLHFTSIYSRSPPTHRPIQLHAPLSDIPSALHPHCKCAHSLPDSFHSRFHAIPFHFHNRNLSLKCLS